jgi:hypothetical protein
MTTRRRAAVATYTFETLRELRVNVSDRNTPYHWSDQDLTLFLDRASGNLNGASAYCLQAWATEEARAWATVSVGGVSRGKQSAADMLMKLAEKYAAQSSGTAVLDQSKAPAFGTARVDWIEHATDRDGTTVVDAEGRRIRSETLETE